MLIGSLLSNEIIIRSQGVDPIHAMIEDNEAGEKVIVDLGSAGGVKVNDGPIDVERPLKAGDVITIGDTTLEIVDAQAVMTVPQMTQDTTAHAPGNEDALEATVAGGSVEEEMGRNAMARHTKALLATEHETSAAVGERLFSPRHAKPSGDVLEVVAYWGSTILDVDLFHPTFKGYEHATIGDPTKAHFIAGGEKDIVNHPIASPTPEGFKLRLLDDMKAKIRKDGKVGEARGPNKISLGKHDLVQIQQGAVSYFMMYIKPPSVILPPNKARDPFFFALLATTMLLYFIAVPALWLTTPKPPSNEDDDIWSVVNMPEKEQPEEKKPPQPKPTPKPPVKVAQKKQEPKPQPPKPKPPEVQPKKPVEPPKKPVPPPKPVPQPKTEEKPPQPKPVDSLPKTAAAQPDNKPPVPDSKAKLKNSLAKLTAGMASTGAATPDFKLAGPRNNNTNADPLKTGGPKGAGMGQTGGGRKGKEGASVMGVEGGKRGLASGVNLSKLGLGAGKIISKTGAGAIHTPFANAAGGAGGGAGHLSKTYGIGGMGTGSSLGLAGSGAALNNFGSGGGGFGSGQGGSGGLGGSGLGRGFGSKDGRGGGAGGAGGHGRADVQVPPGDPVVSGGLTSQEVNAVIRANLNQIRHCYEQLLQRSPNSTGKIKVEFVVGVDGRVTSTGISQSTISDAVMQGCVADKVRRWAFPRPRGGQAVTVKYPFVFNPI
jgi:outer membrane biosynthesis protein TonB